MRKVKYGLLILMGCLLTFGLMITIRAESVTKLKPDPSNKVISDNAGILSQQTIKLVDTKNDHLQKTKQKPVVVVMTVKSTNGETIADWSNELLQQKAWKFGNTKQNNGVLILYAVNKGDRNVRISTGYGVEDVLTDETTHNILLAHKDDLKSSDKAKINRGLQGVVTDVTAKLKTTKQKEKHTNVIAGIIFVIIILGLIIIVLVFRKSDNHDDHDRNHHGGGGYDHRRDDDLSDAFVGLGIGSILGSGLGQSHDHGWDDDSSDWSDGGSSDWGGDFGGGDFGGGGSDI